MLGCTVPTIGGLPKGFSWARKWGCECIQIYVTLSRRWDVPGLSEEEVFKFKSAWQDSPVKKVVAHVPYLVNLASPDKNLWQKSKERLRIELSRAGQFGVNFLVLHPGSYGNSNKLDGMKRTIEAIHAISNASDNQKTQILLETMAGQGTSIGSTFEEIAYILEEINNPEFIGVCFDTAHIFAAGYDIRGYKNYEMVLTEFDEIIGLNKMKAIHVNDSRANLGSRSDRHACIGEGKLGLEIFQAIMKDTRFLTIPKILEIPERGKRSEDNLRLLRKLQLISGHLPKSKNLQKQLIRKELYVNIS
ncbi:MAG: deoxyribonuclease IV [Candidatus Brocadia sp. AMX2]|uniref:Probable endonuclease 4 n=1 Tax=Candidatus Brocadia sinica JPN1 TaxID=1197129 RepID=A0ABQ0JYQ8_9BACT|nr:MULTISPECIES: deoxyribonuclease IV [Brocadia]MBC6931419.1 deoxyribonuclease IV [Candidatus Brocadia sp.]MBL1167525.1 deoxyribonuclease IV [Candidatus Brocadia sp. AMX1]MCK6467517.1 deoxyribonuclease IV [Candidatus Brocadia sinica]NOG40586.1 deoxyribonuclease IV [Planctomycetota bacterium]KAA0244149.1 MAG: deoxyribonuclease IV [Candidatus Brocadia sp. AMX2]